MLFFRLIAILTYRIRRRKSASIATAIILLLTSVVGNSLCFYFFDKQKLVDSLWYSIISITTIGYGDYSAQSIGARIGTVFFIVLVGLSAFGMLMAIATEAFVDIMQKGQRGMGNIMTSNHTIIVNYPGETRIKQIIRELKSDPSHQGDIVIVTNQIEKLPFSAPDIEFVYGSPLEADTFERANLKESNRVIVLAISYNDPNSDPVVASIVSLVESLDPTTFTVAECLDKDHQRMFESSGCDSVVFSLDIAGSLLVQEMNDHGVAQTIDVISSNLKGTTLFSTKVTSNGVKYQHLAKTLLDCDCNLISVIRKEETYTTFKEKQADIGDVVVYVALNRMKWEELLGLVGVG